MALHTLRSSCNPQSAVAGKFKAADLISFLGERAGILTDAASHESRSKDGEGDSKEQAKKEQKQTPQIVRELSLTEFEGLSDEEDAWLVAFYSGMLLAQCKQLIKLQKG